MHKPAPQRKVFDIIPPNRSTAHATAKPILVTNQPTGDDPMMIEPAKQQPTKAVSSAPLLPDNPPAPTKAAHEALAAKPATEPAESQPVAETAAPLSDTTDQTDVTLPDALAMPTDDQEQLAVDTEPAAAPQPTSEAPETVTVATPIQQPATAVQSTAHASHPQTMATDDVSLQQATVDELIQSQRYALPITKQKKRHPVRNSLFVILIIVLLVGVVADVLLDDKIVTTRYNIPHTHYLRSN